MRLLVLSELFLPTKGGTAVWAAEVYKRLGGKEIHIVTADVPGAAAIDATHPNTIHRLNLKRVPWLRPESLAMYLRFFFVSLWLGLTHRFDAIHAFRALPEGLVAWAVARLTLRPVVIYAHGEELTSWGRGGKYRAMRFALRHADRIVANSEHTAASVVSMGVAADRVTLIYPGVDVNIFKPLSGSMDFREKSGILADETLIFSVGRLSRRKGFDQVIQAVAQLRLSGMHLKYVIAGIGEDRAYLDEQICKLKLEGAVQCIGAVSDTDLPCWLNACDIFAMPNREINGDNEGFGMVFIEAAACGKPSLAGTAGGTGSAVVNGVTGIRVEGTDLSAVTDGIVRLINDKDRMGKAALERVRRNFSWEQVAEKTRQLHYTNYSRRF